MGFLIDILQKFTTSQDPETMSKSNVNQNPVCNLARLNNRLKATLYFYLKIYFYRAENVEEAAR